MSSRDKVIISAYTCPLVALAVIKCNLIPVLCDLEKDSFDFCHKSLDKLCDQMTLAIIPTHLGGRVADLEFILSIAKKHEIFVLEDGAQALGASWKGKSVGSWGDIGIFSLGVGKGLTIFSGGAIITKHSKLNELIKTTHNECHSINMRSELKKVFFLFGYFIFYRPLGLGFVFGNSLRKKLKKHQLIEAVGDDCSFDIELNRVSQYRKSIGASALKRLRTFQNETIIRALYRKSLLVRIKNIKVIDDKNGIGTWPFFMILMPSNKSRDEFLNNYWLKKLGVGRLYINALADYDYLEGYFNAAIIPNAQDFASRMLIITNSEWLSQEDFLLVCTGLEHHAQVN